MDILLVVEIIFIGLLVAAVATITWISGVVVYRLFKGQS